MLQTSVYLYSTGWWGRPKPMASLYHLCNQKGNPCLSCLLFLSFALITSVLTFNFYVCGELIFYFILFFVVTLLAFFLQSSLLNLKTCSIKASRNWGSVEQLLSWDFPAASWRWNLCHLEEYTENSSRTYWELHGSLYDISLEACHCQFILFYYFCVNLHHLMWWFMYNICTRQIIYTVPDVCIRITTFCCFIKKYLIFSLYSDIFFLV